MIGVPLRVGIDVTPLVDPLTGIPRFTRSLIDALARRDDIDLSGWLLSARGAKPTFPGPVRRSPVPAAIALRTWARSTWPPARLVAGSVDVVHGTNYLGPPSPRTVLAVHDLTPLTRPDLVEPGVAAKAAAIRTAIAAGASIHVPAQPVAQGLAELVPTDRIEVIHYGLDPAPPTEPGQGRAAAGFDDYVLFVGRTERRKRVPMLVEAMRSLPATVGLVVVGPPGNDDHQLEDAVRRTALGDRYRRLVDVDDHTRTALLADARVLVLPSEDEGHGFPPLEALQVGTPVIATAVGVLPELIGDLIDLAPPDDVRLDERLAATGPQGSVPSAVRERLNAETWDATAAQLVRLYRRAAAS